MFEQLEQCPICKNSEFENYIICADHTVSNESFAIVNCKNCGLKFTNPRPKPDNMDSYYQSENYISHTNNSNSLINMAYKLVRTFTIKSKLNLLDQLSDKGTLLDVGCGTGNFLNACQKRGWKVSGVEPASNAREQTLKIIRENIFSSVFDIENKKSFDIITLWHVLEHLPDLPATMQHLRKLLKKKGKLLIAVPNYQSYDALHYREFWAGYDVPRHLYHFDKKTMKLLFKNYKLKINKIIPLKVDAYYVSLLSEKYRNNNHHYLRAIMNGYRSNRWASSHDQNYSSLIYVASNA